MVKNITLSLFLFMVLLLTASTSFAVSEEEEELEAQNKLRISKAIEYYNDEGYEETIAILRKVRGRHARTAEVQYYMGMAYKGLQEYSLAITHLLKASKRSNKYEGIYLDIAQSQYYSGKYEKALRSSAQAIKNSDNPGKAHLLKGLVLLKKGLYKSSLKEMAKAKAADSSLDYEAEYYSAISHINLNQFTEAREAFELVIQHAPESDLAAHAEDQMYSLKVPESRLDITLSLRHEEDDNVYLIPEAEAYPLGFDEEDREDYRQTVGIDVKYKLARKKGWGINTNYSFYWNYHDVAKSRNLRVNKAVITPYVSNNRVALTVPFLYEYVELDNKRYMDIVSFTPTINGKLSKNSILSFYVKLRKREMHDSASILGLPQTQDRDGLLSLGGLAYYLHSSDKKGFFNIGFEGMKELTDGADWEYVASRTYMGIKIPFRETTFIEFKTEAKTVRYENIDSIFLKRRLENIYTQNIKFTTGMYKKMDFVLEYTNRRHDSQMAFYDYKKQVISAGIDLKY